MGPAQSALSRTAFPGLDLYYIPLCSFNIVIICASILNKKAPIFIDRVLPMQILHNPLTTAGEELDDLDHDLSDLSADHHPSVR